MYLLTLIHRQSVFFYVGAALAITSVSVLYIILRAACDPLRKVPGPRLARFTSLWQLRELVKGNLQLTQIDLHKRYGPIVRMAPNEYSLNDLQAVRTIYGHGSKFLKSDWYRPFGDPTPGLAGIFAEQDEKIHGAVRKQSANLYSMTALLSYEEFVSENITTLISQLTRMASEHQAFPVTDWMQYYAFDVIGAMTVGSPFGFLDHGYDFEGIIKEIHGVQTYGSRLGTIFPQLHPYLLRYGKYVGFKPPRIATQDYILRNIDRKRQLVENGETTENEKGKQDFVGKMLVMQEKGKIDDWGIMNTVAANINAGSDTTGIALSAILYFLIKHPSAMQKLREEIQKQRETGKISQPITFKETQDLPYLQAVIKESLRLHPSSGLSLPRVVPKGGVTLADHFFPAGTIVGINNHVLHRNVDAFGPDAADFRPERWLESKERSIAMDHYFLTFGGGSRTCIGRNISMLEINKLIPELVMKFDFELEKPDEDWKLHNIFFVLQEYNCFVREREVTQ